MEEYGNGKGQIRRAARKRNRRIKKQKPAKGSSDRCSEMTGQQRSKRISCGNKFGTPVKSKKFKTRTRFKTKKKKEEDKPTPQPRYSSSNTRYL